MHGMQESSGGICTSECTHHGTIRRVCIAHFTVRYEGARQPHGGCWRRLAAGRLCGRYQSSTNTTDGVAWLSSGGSGRHRRSRHNLIGRVCRQLTRRLWPGSFGNRRCAFAVPFNEGLLPWFIGLPGQYERPRHSRGSLPAAWCHAQRTINNG